MLSNMLKRASERSKLLADDMAAIVNERKQGSDKQASRKSLEPTTRLRKNSQELMDAQVTDPEIQFIKDKTTDIFGG